ncbi:MAG: hypothetical protein QXR06_02960 [Candidatus Bathyarchaeia archaeon]
MRLENKTSIPISLVDLLDREYWIVERNALIRSKVKVYLDRLTGWKIAIRWKNGKHPFSGFCNPSKKLIAISVNPNNIYPLTCRFTVGAKKAPGGYQYNFETVTFNDAKDLVRFIFLHEFSHLLDYYRGLKMSFKQCKANRFAFANFK